MIKRNNGLTEQEILQNRFSAFVTTAISRARIDYLRKESCRARYSYEIDNEKLSLIPDENDFVSRLCDTDSLTYALRKINEREEYVLLARVIEEKSFEGIAKALGLKYKGVTAIYYRTIEKLKNILGGE